jgi:hypothetical protein
VLVVSADGTPDETAAEIIRRLGLAGHGSPAATPRTRSGPPASSSALR